MIRKLTLLLLFLFIGNAWAAKALPLNLIQLPPGFHINVYAHVPEARQMALGKNGIVFVGTKTNGKVYALIPQDSSFSKPAKVLIVAKDLKYSNGVAYRNGDLYVAEIGKLLRYDDINNYLKESDLAKLKPVVVTDALPKNRHHGLRYIKFGPDGWLYMGVGAPCNVCIPSKPIFGTIVRMQSNGKDLQIYAKGVRNSVGFAWNPNNQKMWFTDNGRDWLGDNLPPDELNYAPREGMNFGFPYFYGDNQPDPVYGRGKSPKGFTPAALDLPAHVAVLGMIFYTGTMFPASYHNQIFIAEHGSWNRSKKDGYQVIVVHLKNNKPVSWNVFAKGWLQGQENWGRPVDVLMLPDGSLLVSDDYAGVIYRISYKK